MKILLWTSLTMSLATGVLAVWVFYHLMNGVIIVPGSMNTIEFYIACGILLLQIVAWLWFTFSVIRDERR